MENIHQLNIVTHVIAGTIALLAGLTAAVVKKGGKRHVQYGRFFMWIMVVVILTALIGVFVFKRNTFLLVITLLSGYTCFSGIRSIKLRGQKPTLLDGVIPIFVMASSIYYLYYIHSLGLYWSPVITYSTIGALFLVTCYDLLKFLMPVHVLFRAMIYEHIYKMMSALSAIASAFSGTVFSNYKPYSQFLPSVMGLIFIIVTFIYYSKKNIFRKTNLVSKSR
ncbi:hypothetical protein [Pedobacter sp.]|uniref:hypothetical protein n=1 Tax=Pedobacter sp. TaxID=1411316 RepID=UPI003D7F2505